MPFPLELVQLPIPYVCTVKISILFLNSSQLWPLHKGLKLAKFQNLTPKMLFLLTRNPNFLTFKIPGVTKLVFPILSSVQNRIVVVYNVTKINLPFYSFYPGKNGGKSTLVVYCNRLAKCLNQG